jgi:hypothetical protein
MGSLARHDRTAVVSKENHDRYDGVPALLAAGRFSAAER